MYNFASAYNVIKIKKIMKTLIIIPSRMSATRLPGKPLIKINGLSMISHVFKKAEEANIGEVYVATEDQEIIDDVKQNWGRAVMTSNMHKSGTDRIFEALKILGKLEVDLVINLQGDEPLMNINDIRNNWSIGNYALSYLLEWCDVYEMVLKKYSYQKKIKLVNYDSLKNNIEYEINDIIEFSGISLDKKELEYSLNIFNFKSDATQNNVLDENDFELKDKINDAKVIYEKLINASLVSK